jgi:arylsulfatase
LYRFLLTIMLGTMFLPSCKELSMSKQFSGTIGLDIRESKEDWTPFEAPKAAPGSPNVLYIVWDDVGFGAFDSYGGPIQTPAMKRIADLGVRFSQFHTTALCSPTRSCFMTGRNATSNGMAVITEAASGLPGFSGRIPPENAMISEVLAERGWRTAAVGKWHLTPEEECNAASSRRLWPLSRGFDRFYGFLGGETDQWYPDLIVDNHSQPQPYGPQQGYHLSKDLADQALRFVRDHNSIAPEQPWMLYYCPGAAHAPHQVPLEWADKYKGHFDMGYEKLREQTLARQKAMGLIPSTVELPALNPYAHIKGPEGQPWPELDTVKPWDSLSAEEKKLFCRMAEVYAGFVSYTDDHIGRILDYLEQSKQLDNTIIVVVSDNGASGEGGPNGSVNENKFFNGIADTLQDNMNYLDVLGSEKTYNHYCTGWAMAFNTPFKMWKRYSSCEGGTADPCIVAWPKGIKARGELRHHYIHAIDIVPTLYDCLGIDPPDAVKGVAQSPIEGISFKAALDNDAAQTGKQFQFYTMLGTRGIWHKGWHANTTHAPLSGWGKFEKDEWELYNLETDRNQTHNLAKQYPDKLEFMKNLWFAQAGRFKGLPLDDRTAVEVLSAPRPQPAIERDRYVYYADTSPIPEAVAVNIRGRSYNIAVHLNINSATACGVLFAHGGRFGGHSLYINEMGKLCYVYNWLGEKEQKLVADTLLPQGECILGLRFRLEGREGSSPQGMAALYVNDTPLAERRIITQPGKFGLGSGLVIGRDEGQPVSSDYQTPFAFHGGAIRKVVIDVSGTPYRDMEREMRSMLMRD